MKLDELVQEINKRQRREVIKRGAMELVRTIPTGLPSLDLAMGGGLALGRQLGIVGHEGAGKTTLALSIAREAQARGFWVLWVDCERSLNCGWAKQIGVDLESDKFGVVSGLTGEDAYRTVRDVLLAIREEGIETRSLVIIDSIAAMVPEDDFENTTTVAPGARLVNRAIRVWNALQTPTVGLILINQYRSATGSIKPVLPHGMGQLYHLSQRVDLKEGQWLKAKNEVVIGKEVKYRVQKSKVSVPYGTGSLDIYFGKEGCYDRSKSLTLAAVQVGLITLSGSWYTFPDGSRVQGINECIFKLDDESTWEDLFTQLIQYYPNKPIEGVESV